MRLALLGDIHGNSFALAAVLKAAKAQRVQKLLITGDFVGYYFWPKEVLDMLADWDLIAVRGNHEEMLIKALQVPEFLLKVSATYGSGLGTAIETLTQAQLEWLCKLPHPASLDFDGRSLLLCHGSPADLNRYVYPDTQVHLNEYCEESIYDWVIFGHTHYQMLQTVGNTVLVNPGSVGQPRNRIPAAQWAILDTTSGELSLMTEPYDVSPVVSLAVKRHPELPYLSNVLLGVR